jgi:SOS-response transcriptional repressor LexA
MQGLTEKQRGTVNDIRHFANEHHYNPTTYELAEMARISHTEIRRRLNAIRRKGYIDWKPRAHRDTHLTEKGIELFGEENAANKD